MKSENGNGSRLLSPKQGASPRRSRKRTLLTQQPHPHGWGTEGQTAPNSAPSVRMGFWGGLIPLSSGLG